MGSEMCIRDRAYFVAAFAQKPTREQLIANGVSERYVDHTLQFGGRSAEMENEWFNIEQVELN